MGKDFKHAHQETQASQACLARSVATVLKDEPALEAVTFNHLRKTISVATLGQVDIPRITERVTNSLKGLDKSAENHCGLLKGEDACQSCSIPLETPLRDWLNIKLEGESTTIARRTCPTAPRFWRWRDIPWPKVVPRDVDMAEHEEHPDEWKGQMIAAVLCGVAALTAWFMNGSPASLYLYILAYIGGSWFTAQEVWERLEKRELDVHFLMLAVAAGSASIGAWGEGSTLLFLFSFSGALEHYALGRTQKEISSLFREAPKTATILDALGSEVETAVETLKPGMRMLIKPGGQFPVDGEILKGQTACDESNLTGEAAPVDKTVGDTVLAGTMNLWGGVEVSITRAANESALQKIIQLIRNAQKQKAPSQLFTDKFSTGYTYAALGLSFVMFFVWWKIIGLPAFHNVDGARSAFYHTMTLLVVASPCALVLSIPSAVLAAIAWGARHGILFRGGAAVEKLAGITTVAMDKTGTLTTGELKVERVESIPPGREDEVASLACAMERLSNHPLARAIVKYGRQQSIADLELQKFESVTGQGVQANFHNDLCLLGRREWVADKSKNKLIAQIEPVAAGLNEVWVTKGDLAGRVVLRDDIRAESAGVVRELKSLGLKAVVLTGDRKAAAEHLKNELQLTDVRGELKPEDKVEAIRSLGGAGGKVAMIGDGVNDAPSLVAADVGVAMGGRGADAALEQADVVLMHDRLENFLEAFKLSQRARGIIRQNLVISLGTVVLLVCFAIAGKIPLTLGVVGHEGSTVVVVLNSLRLLFTKNQVKK